MRSRTPSAALTALRARRTQALRANVGLPRSRLAATAQIALAMTIMLGSAAAHTGVLHVHPNNNHSPSWNKHCSRSYWKIREQVPHSGEQRQTSLSLFRYRAKKVRGTLRQSSSAVTTMSTAQPATPPGLHVG